jgi:hypothetical protein
LRLGASLCGLILLAIAATATLADETAITSSATQTPLCYCNCKQQNGIAMCTKMCELPKYQNRWWARSCQKTNFSIQLPPADKENSKSPRTNHKEQVRRW